MPNIKFDKERIKEAFDIYEQLSMFNIDPVMAIINAKMRSAMLLNGAQQ